MLPVPLLNTAVSVVEFPAVIVVTPAVKLVIAGGGTTPNAAAVVVALPTVFVKTARYLFPLCAAVTAVEVNVADVAPPTLLNVTPLSVLTCHCTVGAGLPLAAAVKLALLPAVTVWFAGFIVIAGPWFTVSVKLCVASAPAPLCAVNVMGYVPPLPAAGVPLSVPVAAVNVTPLGSAPVSLNVGAGSPTAVTVNVPAVPTVKVVLLALVIAGAWSTVSVKFCTASAPIPLCAVSVMG
jgi:hypothetical protein